MRRQNYTPVTLAEEWGCSERHIRGLIANGKLRAFRLGSKLIRIPRAAVEEFECRNSNIESLDIEENSPSSSMTSEETDTVTRLTPMTRARLKGLLRQSTQT